MTSAKNGMQKDLDTLPLDRPLLGVYHGNDQNRVAAIAFPGRADIYGRFNKDLLLRARRCRSGKADPVPEPPPAPSPNPAPLKPALAALTGARGPPMPPKPKPTIPPEKARTQLTEKH